MPRRLGREPRRLIAVALSSAAAPFTGAHPTGLLVADWAWVLLLAGGAAFVGSHAKRGPLLIAASAAVAAADTGLSLACGLVAVAAAALSTRHIERQAPFTRGIGGGGAVLALLAGAGPSQPIVLVGVWVVVLGCIAVSGLRNAPRRSRRWTLRVATVLILAVVLAGLAAGVGTLSARRLTDRGSVALSRGLAAARAGDV
ncbi:MAG: hypothetical protein ACRD0G_01035, partial [Acidimicrobiales bacterium]